MKLPNLWVIAGALLLLVGIVAMFVGIFGGGLVASFGVFGAVTPSAFSIILGVVLIKIGTRPKRFTRRK